VSTEGHITPDDVFLASADSMTLRHCVDCWKHGHATWEEAMMIAAVYLARQNAEFMKEAIRNLATSSPPSLVIHDKAFKATVLNPNAEHS
jgi:hypothetical protein